MLLSHQKAEKVYDGKLENVREAITVIAKEVARPHVFATPYHVMNLASVVWRPIFSVYPDFKSCSCIKNCIHRKFYPRQMFQEREESMPPVIHVMWTTLLPRDDQNWVPNHFVPLIPLEELSVTGGTLSYADVARGRKVTSERPSSNQKAAREAFSRNHASKAPHTIHEAASEPPSRKQQPPSEPPSRKQQPPTEPPSRKQQPPSEPPSWKQQPPTEPPSRKQQPPTEPLSSKHRPPTEPPSSKQQPPTEPPSRKQQPPTEPPSSKQQPPTEPPSRKQQPPT